ncbi:MAG: amidase family protein [Acidimicrobiales bacterium]
MVRPGDRHGRRRTRGPLRGVPFLLKDIGTTQEGTPTYLGNRAMKAADHRASADTVLGARFRAAGLVTLGKTNLPELGTVPVTQPARSGPPTTLGTSRVRPRVPVAAQAPRWHRGWCPSPTPTTAEARPGYRLPGTVWSG